MKKTIIYIGDFQFPCGNVQAQLVLNNGRILRNLDYNVIYIGINNEYPHNTTFNETKGEFEGFKYYSIPFTKGVWDIIYYKKHLNDILKFLDEHSADICSIILYQSPTFSIILNSLARWCNQHGIKFIANCADLPIVTHGSIFSRVIKWFNWAYMTHIIKNKEALQYLLHH